MEPELRMGEVLLTQCLGGKCDVCGKKVEPGPAVQLTKWGIGIRHVECFPKSRRRHGIGNKIGRRLKRKKLPE